jgi:hypothetical protein
MVSASSRQSHPLLYIANLQSLTISSLVYDLTTFIHDHPGGTDALQTSAGTDGTEIYDYAGHSVLNTKNLQQFLVGTLEGAKPSRSILSSSLLPLATNQKVQNLALSLKFLLGLIMIIVAVVYSLWIWQSIVARESEVEDKDKGGSWGVASAFWIGVAVASSLGLLVGTWSWSLFRSTLEHETKYPATIPRHRKK